MISCAIWYHLYNLKSVKNNHGEAYNFTKSNTPPWVFLTFFKLCKWYQNGQRTTNDYISSFKFDDSPLTPENLYKRNKLQSKDLVMKILHEQIKSESFYRDSHRHQKYFFNVSCK